MLLEALELLQSAGDDTSSYVMDFAMYKLVTILTVYAPLLLSTFLLSQEYLGDKIACFAPPDFSDGQADAVEEFCWNNGFWLGSDGQPMKSLYTQPHRFYAFYIAVQAIVCMSPTIIWNILTKSRLLAVLRGTEQFLDDLISTIEDSIEETEFDTEQLANKVKGQIRRFHAICLTSARESKLSYIIIGRQLWEIFLFLTLIIMQFLIYDPSTSKSFQCTLTPLDGANIPCTVPVLDLLPIVWKVNLISLFAAFFIVMFFIQDEIRTHFGKYQPLFYNDLPYGDEDDFNEKVPWKSNATKHSYELLTSLYNENSSIMTKVYVLNAMKPTVQNATTESTHSDSEH